MKNRFTRGALAASSLVLALQFGLVSPASAYTLSADFDDIDRLYTYTATFSTDAPNGTLAAIYANDTRLDYGPLNPPLTVSWNGFEPCEDLDITIRVYDEAYSGSPGDYDDLGWESPYDASYTIKLYGEDTWSDCQNYDPYASDTGDSDEPLAKTGSDASTVAGMTGIAGLTALAVAAAVGLRSRRAQR